MNPSLFYGFLGLFALVSAAALGSCKATSHDIASANGADGSEGAGASNGGSTTGGDGADDTISVGASGSSCEATCSADLKQVVDCNGKVLVACEPDQGCANGACVNDPCEAARIAKSSYGCDYWALKTEVIPQAIGACFAAFIANTWSTPVHIDVEYGGQKLSVADFTRIPSGQGQGLSYIAYDPGAGLPAGQVAILFLSRSRGVLPECPVPAALQSEMDLYGTGRGKAFRIVTDRPVVAYQMLPYGGGTTALTSATLLLPTSVWSTNYIAINSYKKSMQSDELWPSLNILAFEDGTEVTLLPKVAVVGGPDVAGTAAAQPVVYSLSRGEHVQLSQDEELTGSPIQSNKPVGVWGGASCMNIPVSTLACDSAQQQIPPITAMGSEYAAVRYRGRAGGVEEAPPWRVVGAVNGTKLTWEPSPPPGAPDSIDLGEVVELETPGPFVVKSQDKDHPFYVGQYMTGGADFDGEGDPEWVNVIPVAQYLSSYVLFTDPTYPETSLVVVRRPSAQNGMFADVMLDCVGPLTGWKPVGPYEYTRVDLVTGDFQSVGNCSNGRHEMSSSQPFGVTVWGWGSAKAGLSRTYVSYAYPAGASVRSINEVVVSPIPR